MNPTSTNNTTVWLIGGLVALLLVGGVIYAFFVKNNPSNQAGNPIIAPGVGGSGQVTPTATPSVTFAPTESPIPTEMPTEITPSETQMISPTVSP